MAYYDCDFKEVDILEVKSVSDMISAFKTSAADAAKLMGGDEDGAVHPPPVRRFPFGKVRWRARPMGIRYPG